ncbi:hypothetical protein F4778DRAFT_739563 [Xylariomycetidae sp. FL2044]|nr:hypothetical protein F4778DRAFT_739563 [Xylariomycetidae sp. FL2044]
MATKDSCPAKICISQLAACCLGFSNRQSATRETSSYICISFQSPDLSPQYFPSCLFLPILKRSHNYEKRERKRKEKNMFRQSVRRFATTARRAAATTPPVAAADPSPYTLAVSKAQGIANGLTGGMSEQSNL